MTIVSSLVDFDARILINCPLLYLLHVFNPSIPIYRQSRHTTNHIMQVLPPPPADNHANGNGADNNDDDDNGVHIIDGNQNKNQTLPTNAPKNSNHNVFAFPSKSITIRSQYHLEYQILVLSVLTLCITYFALNPYLFFYLRFSFVNDETLTSEYASLLFAVFYISCMVSIIFWVLISRLRIWNIGYYYPTRSRTPPTRMHTQTQTQTRTQAPRTHIHTHTHSAEQQQQQQQRRRRRQQKQSSEILSAAVQMLQTKTPATAEMNSESSGSAMENRVHHHHNHNHNHNNNGNNNSNKAVQLLNHSSDPIGIELSFPNFLQNNMNTNAHATAHANMHMHMHMTNRSSAQYTPGEYKINGYIICVRWMLFGFAICLFVLSSVSSINQALITCIMLGFFYPNLLIACSSLLLYQMDQLPSVLKAQRVITGIIVCGWTVMPLITALFSTLVRASAPWIFWGSLIAFGLAFTMFGNPSHDTISMIAHGRKYSLLQVQVQQAIIDETTALKSCVHSHSHSQCDSPQHPCTAATLSETNREGTEGGAHLSHHHHSRDETSSIFHPKKSIECSHSIIDSNHPLIANNHSHKEQQRECDQNDNTATNVLANSHSHALASSSSSSARVLLNTTEKKQSKHSMMDGGRRFNFTRFCNWEQNIMSSSMGVFQISTFFLNIQSFCIQMVLALYLTWYPTVMFDAYGQSFFMSSLQMLLTGVVVILCATVMSSSLYQWYNYYVFQLFISLSSILFCLLILKISLFPNINIINSWIFVPLFMGLIALLLICTNLIFVRNTPNGCLTFVNGSQQIFQLSAFAIGPLLMGIINSFTHSTDLILYYFWMTIICVLCIQFVISLLCYCTQMLIVVCCVPNDNTHNSKYKLPNNHDDDHEQKKTKALQESNMSDAMADVHCLQHCAVDGHRDDSHFLSMKSRNILLSTDANRNAGHVDIDHTDMRFHLNSNCRAGAAVVDVNARLAIHDNEERHLMFASIDCCQVNTGTGPGTGAIIADECCIIGNIIEREVEFSDISMNSNTTTTAIAMNNHSTKSSDAYQDSNNYGTIT